MNYKTTLTSLICLTSSSLLYSVDVATSTELENAILGANSGGDTTINCTTTIDLSVPFGCPFLRPLNVTDSFTALPPQTITINGNRNALIVTGGTPVRGIFAFSGNSVINDMTFTNTTAQGGTAFTAGGGGAGLGGALFVATGATVTLSNPIFNNSRAIGGDGGPAGQGSSGGGGLLGNGGQGFNVVNPTVPVGGGGGGFGFNGGAGFNGGGGGAGVGFNGDDAPTINDGGGNGGGDFGGLGGGTGGAPGNNGNPGASGAGGGGGGKDNGNGGAGGAGGGGGGGAEGQGNGNRGGNGGDGGAFGGGGGGGLAFGGASPAGNGGNGGFAGGGGGSGTFAASGLSGNGGNGGVFGGGGGTGALTPGSTPGTGGPTGSAIFFGGNGGADPGVGGGGGGGAGCGGAIFIQNGGTLTILGSAQFNGDRAIGGSGGGGGATNGTGAGADIFMMAGGSLIVNNTTNINIPNPIAGDQGVGGGTGGGLSKLGCARLTLNGANTYTGTTTVSAGELRIDGSATTDITVAPGAILSGNFSTTGSIDNAGIIAPGDGNIGTISMNGTFTNQATGIVQTDITPVGTVHDFIIEGAGGATLVPGSTLDIVVNAGNYIAGTQYIVIGAPVTGTFGTNVFQTGVNANLVDIGVTYTNGVVLTILQNFIFQNQAINPGIPSAVSRCIEVADIDSRSDFANIIEQMGLLSSRDVNRALYNMSPVNYGCLDWINARNNNYIADIIDEHLFELCCSPRDCCPCGSNMSVWLDVFGNLMYNTKHYGHMNRFNAEAVGVITGLDYCFCENYTVGAAFAYTHTWLQWKKHHGHGDIDSYYGILYGRYDGCCFDLDVSLIGGGSNHHLHRNIDISGPGVIRALNTNLCAGTNGIVTTPVAIDIDRTAKGDPWGYFFTGHLGISNDWQWCCTNFEPYASIDYNYFHREEFREHGAGDLNLSVREHIQNMLRGEVGVRAYRTWDCDCFCFAPWLGLSWVGEFPLSHSKQRAGFDDQSCTFSVNSYHSSIQLVSPEAGIKFTNPCGFSLWVGYKGLYNSSTNINQVDIGIEWVF